MISSHLARVMRSIRLPSSNRYINIYPHNIINLIISYTTVTVTDTIYIKMYTHTYMYATGINKHK